MTNEKNVPELRFPEFEGEWGEQILEDISAKITEKNKDSQFTETLTNSAEYGIISQRDFFDKDIANEKNLNGYYIVRDNDFVYNPRISNFAPVGPIKRNKLGRTGVMSPLYYVFRPYDIDVVFLEHYFESTGWHKFMKLNGDTGARADRFAIKDSIFKTMPIPYPIKEEQQIIGDFFSKLDRQIELEEQKLAKLEEQKKGYMQKIFSQELRFKDEIGNNYPNWEIEKLGDLINEVNERTISNNQYELLSSTKNGLLSQEEYFKKQIGSKDSTGYKILRLNQLVLSPQNLWLGNINFNQRFDIGIVSPSYRIYNLSHHFDINFAKYLLKSPRYIYEYAQASEQGASVVRRNLNLDLFYSIIISLPSIKEQRKIGSFLNKLDKLIEKQSDKIELLKERKKGFLQKMFV